MTSLTVTTSPAAPSTLDVDVVVVAARQGADGAELVAHSSLAGLHDQLAAIGYTGKADELVRLPALEGSRASVAVVGLGATLSADAARRAAGSAVRQLAGTGSIALAFGLDDEADVHAMMEGASLAAYSFTDYRAKTASKVKAPVGAVTVCTTAAVSAESMERIRIVAEHIALVRDLTNRSGGDLYPQSFADAAIAAAKGAPVTVEVWDEKKLAAEGCGGIIGIG
ncbi:M17 family peptidase N-terminal domain-containing protein, partial [Microcella sp.]|uniref:M17 family peptidase N-terminal domain-containing protein n=1 Tax=Microcella sp. TaxID=1913979 RepID=UPI00299F6AF4